MLRGLGHGSGSRDYTTGAVGAVGGGVAVSERSRATGIFTSAEVLLGQTQTFWHPPENGAMGAVEAAVPG